VLIYFSILNVIWKSDRTIQINYVPIDKYPNNICTEVSRK
jgi:hypothetical protein